MENDNRPNEATEETLHDVVKEYATFGDNPRAEQVRRVKSIIAKVEYCQEELARLGTIYNQFNCPNQEEYCKSLYILFETCRIAAQTFIEHM